MYLSRDGRRTVTVNGTPRNVRVMIHGAYNAMGLIGTEKNGVGIADEDIKAVLCESMCAAPSGMDTPTKEQAELFDKLMSCSDAEFIDAVRKHHNNRGL